MMMDEPFNELIDLLSTIHIFASLSEEQLLSVADRLDTHLYQQDALIFEKGDPADGLYIISSGRVRIMQGSANHQREISTYERGDFFGEEGMIIGQQRKATAICASNLIVYHLKSEQIENLTEEFPEIIAPIRLAIDSFRLIRKKDFKWRSPRESIQFVARRHIFFLGLRLLVPLAIGAITLAITASIFFMATDKNAVAEFAFFLNILVIFGWGIWLIIDWSNDYAIITNRRAVTLEKVALLYEKRREAPLDAILSVESQTGQLGRWFGFGNVIIRTFTGQLLFKHLSQPELVVRLINEKRSRANILARRNQQHSKEDAIRQRLGYEHRKPDPFEDSQSPNPAQIEEKVKPGLIPEWLSAIFRLRTEQAGVITYRTHWIVLLKGIFLPSLFLFFLCVIFLVRIFGVLITIPFGPMLVFFLISATALGLWWLYKFQDWRNDRYIITQDQIIDVFKKPLGQEQKRSAPIKNVQTVEFERVGLISLILNYGTVFVRVGDTTFSFDYVYNPSEAQSEIFSRYYAITQGQKKREQQQLQQEMADWIQVYHQVIQNGGTPPPPPSTDEFSGYNREN